MQSKVRYAVSAVFSALITVAVVLTVYGIHGLYPFGSLSVSWCDMDQQVVPLLMDFKDILLGKGNMLLNMNNAGGMNFWGVFFFFLASPFSFLVLFVEKGDMLSFMNILVMLKMGMTAVCASIFFNSCFKKLNVPSVTALSIAYAFCGFSLLFYQNVIWLDMVWSFPLLLLSIQTLLEKRKPLFFIVMLSLSMVMNYYIGYMLVIFILIGVPLWIMMCTEKEGRKQVSLLFILSCAIAAAITAVVWLPSLVQYMQSARGSTSLFDSLASGDLYGPYTTKSLLLLATPVMFASLPFIPFKEETNKRKLLWTLVMFLLTLTASVFEPVNKMWQTGNYMSFPLRYGYMIAFLGLILCAYVINNHYDNGRFGGTPSAFLWGALTVIAVKFSSTIMIDDYYSTITKFSRSLWGDDKSFHLLTVWCLVSIFAFTLLFALLKMRKFSKRVFSVFLCLAVIYGCAFNGRVYLGASEQEDLNFRIEMDLSDKITDESFVRVKTRNKYFDVNQIGAMGYNSLSHYTSLTDKSYMFAMKKIGYSSYWMEVNSNGGSLITDAILRNQYTISKNTAFAHSDRLIYQNDTYCIIKSAFDIPAGVLLNASPAEYEYLPDIERSDMQDYLFRLYTGSDKSIVTKYEPERISSVNFAYTDSLYTFTLNEGSGKLYYDIWIEGNQSLYFDAFKDISNSLKEALNDSFSVSVNGTTIQSSYPSQSSNGLLYLGDYEDELVSVTVTVKKDALASSFGVFSVNADTFKEEIANIAGCDINVNGNKITANVSSEADRYLYLCLPYMDGYSAKVNGKTVSVSRINDAFIAIPVSAGENSITLTYFPVGFIAGLIISIVGVILLALLLVFLRLMKEDFCNGVVGKISYIAVIVAEIGTVVLVYIMPLFVYFSMNAK